MDWDKLRIFHAVAEAGSFTSAGESLNLSQSAVSRQIATLEDSLQVTLFHRHPRGLVLTEQGEILKDAAADMHTKLSLIEGRISDTHHKTAGPLTLTVSDFIGSTWLAPRLSKFHEQNPNIQLTILFEDRILNLGMREADAALRLRKSKQTDLIQHQLGTIEFHICASTPYLEKHGRPKSVKDLKNHCLIAFPQDTYAPINDPNWLFTRADIDLDHANNALMMNSMYAIHKAVRTHAGIAVLPRYLIDSDDDLEILFPKESRPPAEMYFTYAEERKDSERLARLREFLMAETQDL